MFMPRSNVSKGFFFKFKSSELDAPKVHLQSAIGAYWRPLCQFLKLFSQQYVFIKIFKKFLSFKFSQGIHYLLFMPRSNISKGFFFSNLNWMHPKCIYRVPQASTMPVFKITFTTIFVKNFKKILSFRLSQGIHYLMFMPRSNINKDFFFKFKSS